MVVIHTSNLIVAELNASKEVAMNFNILNSVFEQIFYVDQFYSDESLLSSVSVLVNSLHQIISD